MPSINWIKVGAALAVTVASAMAVFLVYQHYNGLVEAKAALTGQVSTLQADVSREQARAEAFKLTIDKWDAAAEVQAAAIEQFTQAQRDAGRHQRELIDVLSKHDLGKLAKRKPGLIENRVNAGTDRALRMLESASQEAAGTSGDQAAAGPGPARAPAGKN